MVRFEHYDKREERRGDISETWTGYNERRRGEGRNMTVTVKILD